MISELLGFEISGIPGITVAAFGTAIVLVFALLILWGIKFPKLEE